MKQPKQPTGNVPTAIYSIVQEGDDGRPVVVNYCRAANEHGYKRALFNSRAKYGPEVQLIKHSVAKSYNEASRIIDKLRALLKSPPAPTHCHPDDVKLDPLPPLALRLSKETGIVINSDYEALLERYGIDPDSIELPPGTYAIHTY